MPTLRVKERYYKSSIPHKDPYPYSIVPSLTISPFDAAKSVIFMQSFIS